MADVKIPWSLGKSVDLAVGGTGLNLSATASWLADLGQVT